MTHIMNCGDVDDHLGREWTEWKRERLGGMEVVENVEREAG